MRAEDLGDGVVRLTWTPDTDLDAVRRSVAEALESGAHRIEAYVDPADTAAQRTATFSGLRKEGLARGVVDRQDRIVYARLATDVPADQPEGFRALLNSFLPRKRAIGQLLVRTASDSEGSDRVLLCQLTYKRDWDLPGGVVEVGESPQLAVGREVREELALDLTPGRLLLTDWLPPWSGWDDALCLVFDGGVQDPAILNDVVRQEREIRAAAFVTLDEARDRCADFTARRIASALANVGAAGPAYVESGGATLSTP